MQYLPNIFQECEDVISGRKNSDSVPDDVNIFLDALDYAPTDNSLDSRQQKTQQRNRQILLGLASKFERAFELPMPHAPRAAFFGGMVSPEAVGITGHGSVAKGVGGRGTNLRQAFESCIGEAAEFLSFIEWDSDPLIADRGDEHGLCDDALRWALGGIGISDIGESDTLDWVCARSLVDGRAVRFPSELVLRRPAGRRSGKRPAESTGVGAGPTLADAIHSGLMECIERDAIALWWYGGQPAGRIADSTLDAIGFNPYAKKVRAGSERQHWVLDLTTDLDIPVIAVLSSDVEGSRVVAGFSARADRRQAILGAFLEMCQMELAQEISLAKLRHRGEDKLNDQDRVWIDRHENLACSTYPQLVGVSGKNEFTFGRETNPLKCAVGKLFDRKFESFHVNVTRNGIEIPSVRVIVPGLQSCNANYLSSRLRKNATKNRKSLSNLSNALSVI